MRETAVQLCTLFSQLQIAVGSVDEAKAALASTNDTSEVFVI